MAPLKRFLLRPGPPKLPFELCFRVVFCFCPKVERNAVVDTMKTATEASIKKQKYTHGVSAMPGYKKPSETRSKATTTIDAERQRARPSPSLARSGILTFQIRVTGIDITEQVRNRNEHVGGNPCVLRSTSVMISTTVVTSSQIPSRRVRTGSGHCSEF